MPPGGFFWLALGSGTPTNKICCCFSVVLCFPLPGALAFLLLASGAAVHSCRSCVRFFVLFRSPFFSFFPFFRWCAHANPPFLHRQTFFNPALPLARPWTSIAPKVHGRAGKAVHRAEKHYTLGLDFSFKASPLTFLLTKNVPPPVSFFPFCHFAFLLSLFASLASSFFAASHE